MLRFATTRAMQRVLKSVQPSSVALVPRLLDVEVWLVFGLHAPVLRRHQLPPPPPFVTGEAIHVWCPPGHLMYTGCSAPQPVQLAARAPKVGKHALCPWAPPPARGTPSFVGI